MGGGVEEASVSQTRRADATQSDIAQRHTRACGCAAAHARVRLCAARTKRANARSLGNACTPRAPPPRHQCTHLPHGVIRRVLGTCDGRVADAEVEVPDTVLRAAADVARALVRGGDGRREEEVGGELTRVTQLRVPGADVHDHRALRRCERCHREKRVTRVCMLTMVENGDGQRVQIAAAARRRRCVSNAGAGGDGDGRRRASMSVALPSCFTCARAALGARRLLSRTHNEQSITARSVPRPYNIPSPIGAALGPLARAQWLFVPARNLLL